MAEEHSIHISHKPFSEYIIDRFMQDIYIYWGREGLLNKTKNEAVKEKNHRINTQNCKLLHNDIQTRFKNKTSNKLGENFAILNKKGYP